MDLVEEREKTKGEVDVLTHDLKAKDQTGETDEYNRNR